MATLEGKIILLVLFLAAHIIASWKKWYDKRPVVDTITHFLGGLVLGAFLKDWMVAVAIIVGWEIFEMLLVSKHWRSFRETPLNKIRDVLFGLLGFIISLGIF